LAGANQYQRDDYYPFGMEIADVVTSPKNYYLYNKKELQSEFAEYDYGARFYDPVIARWTTMDPLAEKYKSHSSYAYVLNNPIKSIDINGDSLKTKGSNTATSTFKDSEETGMGGSITMDQSNSGQWTMSGETGGMAEYMSDEQMATYDNLNEIISDPKTSSFQLVDGNDPLSQKVAFGDNGQATDANGSKTDPNTGQPYAAVPGVHVIDVGDAQALGSTGLETSQGMIGHELREGYDIQVKGMNPNDAHKDALKTEGEINGTTRLQRGPELDPARASIKMQVFDGTNVHTVSIKLNGTNNWNFSAKDVTGN